jgi:membrane protein implicated in regulation of membrane protease activity
MLLDRLILILVIVIAAAGATVWIASMAAAAFNFGSVGWLTFIPAALIGYVVWRVIAERLKNREDDHYDRIEK